MVEHVGIAVTAVATWDGSWWAVEVPSVPGAFTQARELWQIAGNVREVVNLLTDIPEDSVVVTVRPVMAREASREMMRARLDGFTNEEGVHE